MAPGAPPGREQPGALTTMARPWAGGTVLTLRGELDLATVADFWNALDEALATPGTLVVVDLGDLAFCDSTGLGALLRAQLRAAADGSRLELARPRPLVLRMLELSGAAEALPIRGAPP